MLPGPRRQRQHLALVSHATLSRELDMTPIPQHKAAEREALARAAQQYLRAGGSIKRLPGPTFPPMPARREPPARRKPATRRGDLSAAKARRYREAGPEVIRLFQAELPLKEIGERIGRSAVFVTQCLAAHGINAQAARAEQKRKREAEEVEVIRLLANDGHSIRYAAEQLGHPTPWRVRHLADKHGIRFRTTPRSGADQ